MVVIEHKRYNEYVLENEPHIKSRASYVLLVDYLKRNDEFYGKFELIKYFKFREEFLSNILNNIGYLECSYCHRKDLIIGYTKIEDSHLNNKINNLATIDHIIPLSKGGPKYDVKNCTCSCKKCNRRKNDKNVDEFLNDNIKISKIPSTTVFRYEDWLRKRIMLSKSTIDETKDSNTKIASFNKIKAYEDCLTNPNVDYLKNIINNLEIVKINTNNINEKISIGGKLCAYKQAINYLIIHNNG